MSIANLSFILAAPVLWGLLSSSTAHANAVGNDTQTFNPITSGVDFVTVQGSVPLEMGVLNAGSFINSARNALPDVTDLAGRTYTSDDTLTFADINFGYGLLEWMDIGLNISYLVQQTTSRIDAGAQFSKAGLNEVRGNAKVQLMERKPYGVAIVGSYNVNQVKNNPFLGRDGGNTSNLELVVDGNVGDSIGAINLGYRFRSPGAQIADSYFAPVGNDLIASLAVSHYIPKLDLKVIAEIYGAKPVAKDAKGRSDFASELMVGGKYDYNTNLAMHAGLGTRLSDGLFAPDYRLYAGFNFTFEVLKTTRAPEPAPVIQQIVQRKKIETDIYSGFQPQEIKDLAPKSFEEISKNHEFTLRREMPNDIESAKKPPFEVFRLDGFEFAFGSSVIEPKYKKMLAELINYLNADPPVLKARIEGHTDSLGSEDRNKFRSTSRAEAVRDYLKANGLKRDIQFEAIGYGSQKPIADNSNFQGRTQNRRVEVRILREIAPVEKKTIIEEH